MIRAAIATKHKYGSVALSEEQKARCELLTGYKLENTWLGKNENEETHLLVKNEDGQYDILVEKEAELKKLLSEAE
jgi:hypothetical protein